MLDCRGFSDAYGTSGNVEIPPLDASGVPWYYGKALNANGKRERVSNAGNLTFKFGGDYHTTPLGTVRLNTEVGDFETPCWVKFAIGDGFDLTSLTIHVQDAASFSARPSNLVLCGNPLA